ncbi:hypothetical protein [Prescottella agglutinans]|nr:hypothetical protein [Prescottella agglutinans]
MRTSLIDGEWATLLEPVDTPWGTYSKNSPVRIIDRTDETYLISFDLGDHPTARNHHATVERAVVDAWPEHIEHGTTEAVSVHRRRHEKLCRACSAVNYKSVLAGRITHGKPTISTPVELLAELYLNAPGAVQRRAEDVLHPDVLDAAVYRYDNQEIA